MYNITAAVGRAVRSAERSTVCAERSDDLRKAADGLPPPNNMGVTVAWAGVHWFAGTTRLAVSDVLELLPKHLLAPIVAHERGARGGYGHSASCGGALVAWGDDRPDVFVSLPGSVCEVLSVTDLVGMAAVLELEPTSRLDLAWDAEGFTPADCRAAARRGDVVARVQFSKAESSKWVEDGAGSSTYYMGARTSSRMVRVYDRRGPTRVELEVKAERAVLLWRCLIATSEEGWSAAGMAELRAFVDFRDRSSGVRPDYCELLPWWAEFVEGAERRAVCIPRERQTLERAVSWLRLSVAPTLALAYDVLGPDLVRGMLDAGRERYRRRPDRVALLDAEMIRERLAEAAD